jgi:hypothetical protein
MLSPILENVDESVPHFARRGERASVIPVPPHAAAAAEDTVHGAGESDGEPLEAP